MTLDLNFPPDLFLDLVLDQLFLVQALEGDNVVRFGLGPRHVDAAKLALAERATDLERRERKGHSRSVAVSRRSGGRGREGRGRRCRARERERERGDDGEFLVVRTRNITQHRIQQRGRRSRSSTKNQKRLTCPPRSNRAPTISPPRFRRRTTFSPPRRVRTRRRTVRYRSRRELDREIVPKRTRTTLLVVLGREDLMTTRWVPWFRRGKLLLHLGTCSADHCCCCSSSSSSSSLWHSSGALSIPDQRRLGRPLWLWSH